MIMGGFTRPLRIHAGRHGEPQRPPLSLFSGPRRYTRGPGRLTDPRCPACGLHTPLEDQLHNPTGSGAGQLRRVLRLHPSPPVDGACPGSLTDLSEWTIAERAS